MIRRRVALRSLPPLLFPFAAAFATALRAPALTQARLRRRLAAAAATTAYGRSHGVRGAGDFERLPVVDWDDLAPWVARQQAEEGRVLCPQPVRFYERTSGSSGASKLVPYTAGLQQDFSAMFGAWAWDVLTRGPRLRSGRTYISVSPRLGAAQTTATGRPIGLEDDAAYLDGWMQALLRRFLVPVDSRFADGEAFRDATALALLRASDLEVVSVWNPTFLEVLLDHVTLHADRLARHLPTDRARLLRGELDWARIWPRLTVLSCWDQGPAAPMAARLARRLPHAMLQGKGLLATEGAVTVPWLRAEGCLPLLHRTLIELRDDRGDLLPLMAGRVSATYEVVISTRGGLLRYALGDRVQITHRYRGVPVLRFVGRAGGVSDLVGEKLTERFVADALASVLPSSAALRTLVPLTGPPARYALLTDEPLPADAASRVDEALRRAHHYGLARELGQLGPLVACSDPAAGRWLTEHETRRGLRLGDIKPRALQLHPADPALTLQLSPSR